MSILELFDIKHPIFLAPMAGVSTPLLAAEVSNAGGLGSLGLGASSVESARQQILDTQALTDHPFQVNFFCHHSVAPQPELNHQWIESIAPQFKKYNATEPDTLNCIYPSFLDNDDYLNVLLETQPKAVSFHFGIPHAHQIQALKDAGIVTLVSATNLAESQAIEAAGIDVIIAQGIEAGGHRAIFNPSFDAAINTANLVKLIKAHCKTPLIAAGGIMNGFQAQYLMNLGADAVQLGTAFVQCPSSNANAAYREALFSQPLTQITASISGRPARGILNDWAKLVDVPTRGTVAPYPYAYDLAKQLHAIASAQHDQGFGAFWAGANVTQIRALDVEALMQHLRAEMHEFD